MLLIKAPLQKFWKLQRVKLMRNFSRENRSYHLIFFNLLVEKEFIML